MNTASKILEVTAKTVLNTVATSNELNTINIQAVNDFSISFDDIVCHNFVAALSSKIIILPS